MFTATQETHPIFISLEQIKLLFPKKWINSKCEYAFRQDGKLYEVTENGYFMLKKTQPDKNKYTIENGVFRFNLTTHLAINGET